MLPKKKKRTRRKKMKMKTAVINKDGAGIFGDCAGEKSKSNRRLNRSKCPNQ